MDSRVEFPEGRYYAVAWGIQPTHGGMTNAMLHRSRAFVEYAGVDVTVVTYEYLPDLDATRESLAQRGRTVPGISIINMWEDLQTWDDEKLRTMLDGPTTAGDEYFQPRDPSERGDSLFIEIPRPGGFSQRDYYRPDGTLLASHRVKVKGDKGVAVHLCDSQGNPIGWFSRARDLYRFWLDTLPKDPVSFFMIDSKTAANHYPEYQRPDVVTVYMVHGSHLADGVTDPLGELSGGRKSSFQRLDKFDGVVVLTEGQRQDIVARNTGQDQIFVCPNSRDAEAVDIDEPRDERAGIAMGNLVAGKRFSHAMKAVHTARKWRAKTTLEIFGKGERRAKLSDFISKHKFGDFVQLAGFTDNPAAEFAKRSYLLVTSNREGFGLVILEAMAQGCIPISYDIKYGPGDIITHGVNGFLVPAGDTKAMGRTIAKFLRMSKSRKEAMREAARARAAEFSDEAVVAQWAGVFESTLDAKDRSPITAG